MSTDVSEWVGVEYVKAYLNLESNRAAWELIKSLQVPCIGPTRDRMDKARFTREDFLRCLEASKQPPTPRKPPGQTRPETAKPGVTRRTKGAAEKLRALRQA